MSESTFPAYGGQDEDRRSGQYNPTNPTNNYGRDSGQGSQGGQGGYPSNSYNPPPNQGGYPQRQGGYQGNNNQGGNKQWGGNNQGGGASKFQRKPETDLTLYKPYAFVVNDEIPKEVMERIAELFKRLEDMEYTMRVGGMKGPDEYAESCVKKKEVHLPWRGFNDKESKFTWTSERAVAVAKMFHPAFDSMKKGVQTFLAKNARLILGDKVNSPALFLITWTEDGAESSREKTSRTGFAGHPIAIASALGIPIFNFGRDDAFERLDRYLASIAE